MYSLLEEQRFTGATHRIFQMKIASSSGLTHKPVGGPADGDLFFHVFKVLGRLCVAVAWRIEQLLSMETPNSLLTK